MASFGIIDCITWSNFGHLVALQSGTPIRSNRFLRSVLATVVEKAASRNDFVVSESSTRFPEPSSSSIASWSTAVGCCLCCISSTLLWRETICRCIPFNRSIIVFSSSSPILPFTPRLILMHSRTKFTLHLLSVSKKKKPKCESGTCIYRQRHVL